MLILGLSAAAFACGQDEIQILSRLSETASLEVRAPRSEPSGSCDQPFPERFCAEEYEVIGVVDIPPAEERVLAVADSVTDEQCSNILWLRLVRLGNVGPINDAGALFQLPAEIELEMGAGALHSVAFPQATVRIDEVGTLDANQSQPPKACNDRE